jgi:hypothetical protein
MTTTDPGAARAEERARIAALLSRYPNLAEDELAAIDRWFRKDATALDIGMLASDESIVAQYRAYRAEHYDRFKPGDYGRASAFVLGVAAVVLGIAFLMP